jgi:hypothetical protein
LHSKKGQQKGENKDEWTVCGPKASEGSNGAESKGCVCARGGREGLYLGRAADVESEQGELAEGWEAA